MKRTNKEAIHKKIHRPLCFNGMVWLFSYVILLFAFSKGKSPIKIDFIYTIGFLVTVALPVLINLYILIPKLLKREKYVYYALGFVVNLILFTKLNQWFLEPILDWWFPNYFFISYTNVLGINTIFIIFLIATTLLKLSEDWFYFNKEENRRLKLDNQHIQMQLTSLRSQINPHFLFNSLNVIYALALEKKEETKDAIVQLSDILRYVIYDSNTLAIPLKDEITLLKNYIDFHKFRSHNFKNIRFTTAIENENYSLYPMLLLPLVENSFKHSTSDDSGNAFITINILQKENTFVFSIKNNTIKNEDILPNEHSGIGLENIKNNLELVYPNTHTFKVEETEDTFAVNVTLTDTKSFSNEH
tara:strand:+ start:1477 stop:2553 length:1077 start_codon:yes stop_codon:yes gene_type:complete